MRMVKIGLKFLGGVLALVLVGVLAIVVIAVSYDYDQLKPVIVKVVQNATGRDLKIAGNIDLAVSFDPLPMPVLSVTDVSFSNAPWGRARPMVRLERLNAKIDLLALFNGQLKVDSIMVDGLSVFLETDAKGRANWKFPLPVRVPKNVSVAPASGFPLTPVIRNVSLRNMRVSFRDGVTKKDISFLVPAVKLNETRFSAPIFADVDVSYKGVPIEVRGKFGSLEQLTGVDDTTFPIRLKLTFPGFNARMVADVKSPLGNNMDFSARLNGEVTDKKALEKILGPGVPSVLPLKGGITLAGRGTRLVFSDLALQAGNSTVSGNGNIDFSSLRPRVRIKLDSGVLDFDTLMGTRKNAAKANRKVKVSSRLFSGAPLPWALLKTADGEVKISIKRLKIAGLLMSKARIRANLSAGLLQVKEVRFALGGGVVSATARLNGAPGVPSVQLRARLTKVDVGRVLKMRGFGNILVLPVSGKIRLSGSGVSVRRIMGDLNGSLQAAAHDGRIDSTAFSDLTTGAGSILPWAAQKDAGTITCMIADWRVKAGVATARNVLVDTPGFRVALSGNADLGREKLNLIILPRAKTLSLASVAVPVRLQGSFSTPSVKVSPKDLVVGTVKNVANAPVNIVSDLLGAVGMGSDKNAPCVEALGGGKTKIKKTSTKKAATPQSRGFNRVKDFGNTLSNGLNKAFNGLFGP